MTVIAQSLIIRPTHHSGFGLVLSFALVGLLASLVLAQLGVDLNASMIG